MPKSVSVAALNEALRGAEPPIVLDVRRAQAFADSPSVIPGATRLLPETVDSWAGEIPKARQVVAYCVLGQQVSQGVVARLEQLGIDACFLEGGIEQWKADGGAVSAAALSSADEGASPGTPVDSSGGER